MEFFFRRAAVASLALALGLMIGAVTYHDFGFLSVASSAFSLLGAWRVYRYGLPS